jgi:biotin synthase-related radical SAM superfamily protein
MCGHGLNWQHCARMAFVGRSFSYETYYQAVRRCWRYMQRRPVDVHLVVAEGEAEIGRVIDRKAGDHAKMKEAMRAAMARNMGAGAKVKVEYDPKHQARLPSWIRSAA